MTLENPYLMVLNAKITIQAERCSEVTSLGEKLTVKVTRRDNGIYNNCTNTILMPTIT